MRTTLIVACIWLTGAALAGEEFRMNPDLANLGDNTWRKLDPQFVYHPDQFKLLEKAGWKLKDLPLKPGGKFCHWKAEASLCYDESQNLTIYFGGCTSGYGNNHWVYDCSKNVWTQIHPDIFKLEGRWRYREDTKSHPPGCCSYGICYDSASRVSAIARANGGATAWKKCKGPPNNHMWLYDAAAKKWRFTPKNGKVPDAYMTGTRLAYDPAKKECLLFAHLSRAIWAYSAEKNTWRLVNITGPKPAKRGMASWIYMEEPKKFLLYGGQGSKADNPRTTWLYDHAEEKWEDVTAKNDPLTRCSSAAAYDSLNNVVVMIGGFHVAPSKKLQDGTWIFDPAQKSWTQLRPDPMPRITGQIYQMSYDRVNNVMIYLTKAQTWVYRCKAKREE
ncbi:MAG: Kelch repeat-containing protein [Planctomycetota bacterium]|jgi:hypothetical protein